MSLHNTEAIYEFELFPTGENVKSVLQLHRRQFNYDQVGALFSVKCVRRKGTYIVGNQELSQSSNETLIQLRKNRLECFLFCRRYVIMIF